MSVNGEVRFATFTLFYSFARCMRFRTRGRKEEKKTFTFNHFERVINGVAAAGEDGGQYDAAVKSN